MIHSEKRGFDSLQVFRGLAALGVVISHAGLSTNAFAGKIPSWLNSVFEQGFLGVDFFFVLSGFIIMSSHFDDEKSITSIKTYGVKRFLRIFPPYWPVSISLILAYFVLPGMSQGNRGEFSWLSSLLLLPDSPPPALSVAWTLIHEVMFYMIFCVYFVSNRLFMLFVSGWVLTICMVAWFARGAEYSPFLVRFLSPINLEFVMGMVVAYFARVTSTQFAKFFLFSGVFLLAVWLWLPVNEEMRVLFGVPFSLIVLGAVLLERKEKLILPRWMVLMGDASYSIYLIHNPLVSLTSRLVARLHGYASWGLGMFVGIISSVIVGVLYHLLVEKPLIRFFRQRLKRMGMA